MAPGGTEAKEEPVHNPCPLGPSQEKPPRWVACSGLGGLLMEVVGSGGYGRAAVLYCDGKR
jgi:hypothetical protein